MIDLDEIEDRIAKCNKLLDANPNSQIFAALAEAYRKKGDIDQAFRICQTGLRIHPDYGSAHMVMARINVDKGMFDWAEIEANKVIDIEGNSHTTDLLLAEIYISKGEFTKASKLLDELHKNDPANSQVNRFLELVKKNEAKEAIATIEPTKKSATEQIEETESSSVQIVRMTPRELMDAISEISNVNGVLLVNNDGMVAESKWENNTKLDLFGALAKDIEQTIQTQMDSSVFGRFENILIECEDLIINMIPQKDYLILIKANGQINLGTLKLRMNALLDRLNQSEKTAGVQK